MKTRSTLFAHLPDPDEGKVKKVFRVGEILPTDLSPLELFSGFRNLRAITYSHSLSFLGRIAKDFDSIEVILGSPRTLTIRNTAFGLSVPSLELEIEEENEILKTIRRSLKSYPELRSVRMRIAIGKPSHEKLYLLDHPDGKRRAIFGSGNLSSMAFDQGQDEGFYFSDAQETFALLNEVYEQLHARSLEPDPKLFRLSENGEEPTTEIEAQDLPIVIQTQKVGTLDILSRSDPGFARAIRVIAPRVPPAEIPGKMSGKQLMKIAGNYLHVLRPQLREQREDFQPITFDFDAGFIRKGEAILGDFSATPEELGEDIATLTEWTGSYRRANFLGDKDFALRGFDLLLVFALTSPFLPVLHHVAARDGRGGFQYPLMAIVFGPSSGGKTSFLECLRPLTFRVDAETGGMKFTASDMDRYRLSSRQGLLIKDDVPKRAIQTHLEPIVKKDEFMKTNILAPAIISTNREVQGLEASILKRAIPILIDARAVGAVHTVTVKRLGHGLFKEFIRNFLPIFKRRLEGMEQSHVLVEASQVLSTIMPGFVAFDEGEILFRRYASFRKRFASILREKERDGSVLRQGRMLVIRFDSSEDAREFASEVPEDAGAEIGEKSIAIPFEGLERIGALYASQGEGVLSRLKKKFLG